MYKPWVFVSTPVSRTPLSIDAGEVLRLESSSSHLASQSHWNSSGAPVAMLRHLPTVPGMRPSRILQRTSILTDTHISLSLLYGRGERASQSNHFPLADLHPPSSPPPPARLSSSHLMRRLLRVLHPALFQGAVPLLLAAVSLRWGAASCRACAREHEPRAASEWQGRGVVWSAVRWTFAGFEG